LGHRLLEEPGAENLLILNDDRVAFTGGSLAILDAGRSRSLRSYLAAAVRQEPDRACQYLLRESYSTKACASQDELHRQFRQAEPFRDGGWSDRYASLQLANSLFVHWRLARQGGYRPKAHLLAFFLGLAAVERVARQLSPHRDALKLALGDLRIIAAAVDLRELAGPTRLRENAERLLPAMLELMHRIDDLAGLTEQEPPKVKSEMENPSAAGRRGTSWLLVSGLLLVLVAFALILAKLGGFWAEKTGAALFASLTALLLWIVVRGRAG
jgi:predicted unusual protein kinase regulating ubiquinone biosynthesis (AarF/ABC1/UbiB family)